MQWTKCCFTYNGVDIFRDVMFLSCNNFLGGKKYVIEY